MAEYEIRHRNRVRALAPECTVLLKSDGSFPLMEPCRLALYGNGARRTLKGGRGSADVNVKEYITVEQGLKNAGFALTTEKWLDAYEEEWRKERRGFRAWLKEKISAEGMERLMENLSIVMPEPEYELPLDGAGDVAVYVLSRLCGEGVDRQDVKGDFRLSDTEVRDILKLQEQYKKFMLVLNTGCIVDLSPVADRVVNILQLSQLGSDVGNVFADLILGKAYPSGKLTATWTCAEDYGKIGEFGNRNDTRYREGIYVGYRYFDTIGKNVLFPFGYGIGYTTFAVQTGEFTVDKNRVICPVTVKNTGNFAGKEVIQVYVSLPEKKLDQPWQVLAAFQKTKELAPGETCKVMFSIPFESLASTDSVAHKRILEDGEYLFRFGTSSRNTKAVGIVVLKQSVVIEELTQVGGKTDFEDWKPGREERLATLPEANGDNIPKVIIDSRDIPKIQHHASENSQKAAAFVKKLSGEELVYLCTGEFVGEGSKNIIGDAAITVAGAAGETTGRFKDKGIHNLIMADGPSGLRLKRVYGRDEKGIYPIEDGSDPLMEIEDKMELIPEDIAKILAAMMPKQEERKRTGEVFEQNCTAIPIATAIAQTWNEKAAEAFADIVAGEMVYFGIHIWLAPALNIQRHPLCGRTFEYYSEDPLISGKMAAAITRGIQKHPGRGVTIKHFICNNQETNRFRSNSMVNERTLRDIYAKGFEIVVRESDPVAFMSSYNLLNGIHTSERPDLLNTLLREEWGYKGIVMSDYLGGEKDNPDTENHYRKFYSAESVKAGNDLMMPGGSAHYQNILDAMRGQAECELTRAEVEQCAARNVMLAWKLAGIHSMA